VLTSLHPAGFVDGLDPSSEPAAAGDPTLDDPLITAADLPPGYMSLGTFNYRVPTELGSIDMAASIFSLGDVATTGELPAMVMSIAVAMTPQLRAELDAAGGLGALSQADLQEGLAEAAEYGLTDVRLLDGSTLGEGGAGMHMTMDFSSWFGAFGAPPEQDMPMSAISTDWYMFVDGDRLLMVYAMWPGGGNAPIDTLGLAETMDARSG
jgi:hypothetical protein